MDSQENKGEKKKRSKKNARNPETAAAVSGDTVSKTLSPHPQAAATSEPPKSSPSPPPLSQLSLDSDLLPPQKRSLGQFPGKQGTPCRLAANHFQISLVGNSKLPNGVLYMYSLSVVPPWPRDYRKSDRPLYHRVLQQWKATAPQLTNPYAWVYDGNKTLYSTKEARNTEALSWTVTVPESKEEPRQLEFTIKDLTLVKRIPVSQELAEWAARGRSGSVPQDSIHLLDVLLSQAVNLNLNYTTIGRSYYLPTKGTVLDIGFGKEVWTGLFSSVRPMGWKDGGVLLTLNVDVSNKPATKELHLTQGGEQSYIQQLLSGSRRRQPVDYSKGLNREQVEILEKDLKGLKVRYQFPNGNKRGYRVNGVKEPAKSLVIPDLEITVAQYFKQTYKKSLQFPSMPCLWVGSREKTIYIPVELCYMAAQALPRNKALHEDATAKMIRGTAVNPLERQKKILDGLKANNDMFRKDPYTKEFGINVAGTMANINGRILAPPSLQYRKPDAVVHIDRKKPGSWMQGRGMEYVEGSTMDYWAVIDMVRMSTEVFDTMVSALTKVGKQNGLKITNEPANLWRQVETREDRVEAAFQQVIDEYKKIKMKLQMVLVVLPFKGGQVYDKVKQLGDIKYRVPTQCVLKAKLFKPDGSVNNQVLGNLCLKINSKLGGTNHVLSSQSRPEILKRPVMIMGADVAHPSPEHRGSKPSIAAIVASTDPRASKYEVQVRIQSSEHNEEVINDMKEVTKILLKRYLEETNRKPEKVVMYRDGVSEGQFLTVLARELTAIRAACTELCPDYKPEITYLVVQKRHHTRFFPTDNNQYQRNNNALAGTVVDQGINHPTEGDFYLLSHEGIQGTSRPCHYQVLWDDANMTADALETLSYYLCHLYARCTRSVSYPTPTYYSHLAADRARKHHNELILREKPERVKKIIEESKINMMYFV